MARSRVTTQSVNGRRGRSSTANPLLPFLFDDSQLLDIQDRRLFHPLQPVQPAASFSEVFSPIEVVRPGRPPGVKNRSYEYSQKKVLASLQFSAPDNVLICVRRKQRKQVLHALGKAGKSGQRKPRRGYYSDVRC